MKVLLVNGSPHKEGCTYTALREVEKELNKQGIDTEIFWIGIKPIAGCIACKSCAKTGKCAFDDIVNEFLEMAKGLENEPERGNRCKVCYQMRMEKTAILAKENKLSFKK